jgi:hypothetical protein
MVFAREVKANLLMEWGSEKACDPLSKRSALPSAELSATKSCERSWREAGKESVGKNAAWYAQSKLGEKSPRILSSNVGSESAR